MLEEKANKKSPEWLNASEKLNDLNFQFPILASTFDVSQSHSNLIYTHLHRVNLKPIKKCGKPHVG